MESNPKRPPRKLDLLKLDALQFEAMLNAHTRAVEQCMCDLTIAVGAVVGHDKLAAALQARINDSGLERPSMAEPLLDAIWRASLQRAAKDLRSRT